MLTDLHHVFVFYLLNRPLINKKDKLRLIRAKCNSFGRSRRQATKKASGVGTPGKRLSLKIKF